MIDPLLSLAFAVHSGPGVYALLLGSGVSRAASIPTGWEVIQDLIRKIARLRSEDPEPDPAAWYRQTLGVDPNYSDLLEAVGRSPAERARLLRSYFEPTEEEREHGIKTPTVAHRAIARLVARGFIRVIVTPNFDRLLETALEAELIVPTVIHTADAAKGALPLAHSRCTIVKPHGDYVDGRLRNTRGELEKLDKPIDRLLDRIFDEYGLVVCGWSGEWDTALRAALERTPNRRFTTCWVTRGEPTALAQNLIQHRKAEVIRTKHADHFFQALVEKVQALDDLAKPHPLSAKTAVSTLKNYLADDRHRIRLHDLVVGEVDRLQREIVSDERFPLGTVVPSRETIRDRVSSYEALSETLIAMMAAGCFFGDASHDSLWCRCIERVLPPARNQGGYVVWQTLRSYPALIALYAGGIAALAAERYRTFATLLVEPKILEEGRRGSPVVRSVTTWSVLKQDAARQLPDMERRHTPVSDHLYRLLRAPLSEFIGDELRYEEIFDRFEYLFSLVHADLEEKSGWRARGPVGRFGWRIQRQDHGILAQVDAEIEASGADLPILKAGLFDGSVERLRQIKNAYDKEVQELSWW